MCKPYVPYVPMWVPNLFGSRPISNWDTTILWDFDHKVLNC
jgi:hypothetical protein